MRALAAVHRGQLAWVEVPMPEPGPYDALVQIEACGWCNNTDWQLAQGNVGWAAPPPLLLGHESVGTVIAVGERVTKFAVGDRVTRAYAGLQGSAVAGYGVFMGGFAEYGLVSDGPAKMAAGLAPVDDYTLPRQNVVAAHLAPEVAALAISLAETASFVQHLGALGSATVLIAGTGIAGVSMAYWAKLAGARRVVVLGRRDARLALAAEIAADAVVNVTAADPQDIPAALGGPAHFFIDAVGDPSYTAQAAAWLAEGGTFAPYGLLPPETHYAPLPASVRLAPMVVNEHETYPWVAELVRRNLIRPERFLTHIWQPDTLIAGIRDARNGQVLKGVVRFPA